MILKTIPPKINDPQIVMLHTFLDPGLLHNYIYYIFFYFLPFFGAAMETRRSNSGDDHDFVRRPLKYI